MMTHSTHKHTAYDFTHRRTHRKRFSASKSSTDILHTHPRYSSPQSRSGSIEPFRAEAESDRPPDYPDTADETDADTEGDHEDYPIYFQHHPVHSPARRPSVNVRRRTRVHPVTDPFLDTLLERSVDALEMSNTLLRTTMSTQSSLSTLLSSEECPDHFLEVRARNLSTRITANSGLHETWMDRLEEISEGVNMLFGEEGRCLTVSRSDNGAVSRSLPTPTAPDLRHRRKPSILELNASSNSHLRYSHPTRDVLVAPAPRALTQYVESTADPQLITLPSTLGLRASGSSHSVHSKDSSSASCRGSLSPLAEGIFPEARLETKSAYHFLASIVKHSGSPTRPPSARPLRPHDRRTSTSPTGSARGLVLPSPVRTICSSPNCGTSEMQMRTTSRSETSRGTSISPDPLSTTPIDEVEHSASSSDSSDCPTGYRTVQSLRKILDNHLSSMSVDTFQRKDPKSLRAPAFLPITPPPAPIQVTSTATASISRLYTKGRHSMSTRPPSPPVHSSLKVRSVPPTPFPSPSSMSLSELFGNGIARLKGSTPSSGVSTPKRISFAELPESYSGSRPGMSRQRARQGRKKRQGEFSDQEAAGGWLTTFLRAGWSAGTLGSIGTREERIEERMVRGWGSRPGYGTLDDWAV